MISPHEKNEGVRILEAALEQLKSMPTTTKCEDCNNYQSGDCLKWGEKIPAETLEMGCDEWVFSPLSPPF